MHRCLISFGANLGDPRATVTAAAQMITDLMPAGDSLQLSRLYTTPPVGGPSGQSQFINAVAAVATRLSPWEVWHLIRQVEQQLGRERIRRWEARRIDLDMLLFDDQRIWTPQLKIPHPRMCMRRFILEPACDVAADWIDPVSEMSIQQLAANLRVGAGRVLVAADPAPTAIGDADEVVRSGALWLDLDQFVMLPFDKVPTAGREQPRLVLTTSLEPLIANDECHRSRPPNPARLLICWVPAADDCAWEDQHQRLAAQLRLTAPTSGSQIDPLPIDGPRYLLATSDPAWAAHEIAAALEAMDCHIEVAE